MEELAKNKAKKEYMKRLRQVLKSKLNAKNKIQAINAYAIPVISYTGGIIKWRSDELKQINSRTRKIMTMHGALHPRADVDRLYVSRKKGGRGLKDIAEVIQREDRSLSEYVHKNEYDDPLLAVVKTSGAYRRMSDSLEAWQEKTEKDREDRWKQKPLANTQSK